jgi:hypothetical protein
VPGEKEQILPFQAVHCVVSGHHPDGRLAFVGILVMVNPNPRHITYLPPPGSNGDAGSGDAGTDMPPNS